MIFLSLSCALLGYLALYITLSRTIYIHMYIYICTFLAFLPTLMLLWNIHSIFIQFWLMACKCFAPFHIIEACDIYILKVARFSPTSPPILMYNSRASFGVVGQQKNVIVYLIWLFCMSFSCGKGLILNPRKKIMSLSHFGSWLAHAPLELRRVSLNSCAELYCRGPPRCYFFAGKDHRYQWYLGAC